MQYLIVRYVSAIINGRRESARASLNGMENDIPVGARGARHHFVPYRVYPPTDSRITSLRGLVCFIECTDYRCYFFKGISPKN